MATEPLARDEVSEILSGPYGAVSAFDFVVFLGAMAEDVFLALLRYTCEYIQKLINLKRRRALSSTRIIYNKKNTCIY